MNKFVEASDALLKQISEVIALGERPESFILPPSHEDLFLDVKILCHEFGNPAITDLMNTKTPTLALCQKALEKIRDTALFRIRGDS